MGLEPEHLFSSTVLVFWATAFVPWFLKEERYSYFVGSWILLFLTRLSISWDPEHMAREIYYSFITMLIMSVGGYVMFRYIKWKEEQGNESADKE